jgi:hypothetical protein
MLPGSPLDDDAFGSETAPTITVMISLLAKSSWALGALGGGGQVPRSVFSTFGEPYMASGNLLYHWHRSLKARALHLMPVQWRFCLASLYKCLM